jgi:hypothetical protein
MTRFEFNSVFVAIILAFAVSEILVAWGRLIRHRAEVKLSWFYLAISPGLLLFIVLHWFGFWAYQDVPFDEGLQPVVVILPPLVLALIAFVLTPEINRGQRFDLEAYYFEVSRWVFPLLGLTMVLALVSDVALDISETESPVFYLIPAVILASVGFTQRRVIHVLGLAFYWVMGLGFLFFGVA